MYIETEIFVAAMTAAESHILGIFKKGAKVV